MLRTRQPQKALAARRRSWERCPGSCGGQRRRASSRRRGDQGRRRQRGHPLQDCPSSWRRSTGPVAALMPPCGTSAAAAPSRPIAAATGGGSK
eukprot:4272773-Pyramimonas_sp.AAC.1